MPLPKHPVVRHIWCELLPMKASLGQTGLAMSPVDSNAFASQAHFSACIYRCHYQFRTSNNNPSSLSPGSVCCAASRTVSNARAVREKDMTQRAVRYWCPQAERNETFRPVLALCACLSKRFALEWHIDHIRLSAYMRCVAHDARDAFGQLGPT